MAEGNEVPVTQTTSNTLTTNTPTVTTTMTNTEATTSGVGLTTQSQTSDVTSTTVTTVTTSLATLNLATDEARVSTSSFPESVPLLYSVNEMQLQDQITTHTTETLQSSRLVLSERPVRSHSENINVLQAAATQEFGGSQTSSTTGGASAAPTDEATRWYPLINPTEVSTQTPEGAHALAQGSDSQPRMVADESSTVEEIISPRLLAEMVAMERQRHTMMNLSTQGEEFSWDNMQFISDLIFHTDICQSNSNYIVERISHFQHLTTWILQLLECDADCVISLRRELENLLESSLAMASHLADPASHHDQETLLMRPIFPEPRRLDSMTLGYISFDPFEFRPILPLDPSPQESPLSQNSAMGVPSLWDEEQFDNTSSQASRSPVVSTTAGLNTYVYDSQASTLPIQDQVVDYSLPVDINNHTNDYVSEGNDTPEDSASEEADH